MSDSAPPAPPVRFLHTADWQLGKGFANVADDDKRARLRQERVDAIARLAQAATAHGAEFVLVAGDLFDSTLPTDATISAACAALGGLGVPVLVIPGNHDHAGPGSVWEREFFRREAAQLAPNLRLLTAAEPLVLERAVILPCPRLRRVESADPTAWLRRPDWAQALPPGLPRIVLAHGSVHGFGATTEEARTSGEIDLERLPLGEIDYVALGDWHGVKTIPPKAWYAGTPAHDRFPKGGDYVSGHALAVSVIRGGTPEVQPVPTAAVQWWREEAALGEAGVAGLEARLQERFGARTGEDVLELRLAGAVDFAGSVELASCLARWQARLLHLRLFDATTTAPSESELAGLTTQALDPVTARVAGRLAALAGGENGEAEIARAALRTLYEEVRR
ncbi:MAG: DNA repair exonuclease [Verrucomicrobia bacterium]|nr:DNA repair exonuclease [Verrucomicrobiota bacterium]